MGIMIKYGRTREDVLRWPDDPAARRALESYLDALPHDSLARMAPLNGMGLDFTGADLSGLDLSGAEFGEAILNGIRLVGADLFGVWMMGATLRAANLSQCNLRKSKGRNCDAQHALFAGVDFERSEFEDADFRRADLRTVRFGSAWLPDADMRGADLRECTFGQGGRATGISGVRLAGCRVEGATGLVSGPVDVSTETPRLLDGDDLQRWFADHGAPLVEVRQPTPRQA
jgi:uncharacterized protein YjbI with pentapeptide repeats